MGDGVIRQIAELRLHPPHNIAEREHGVGAFVVADPRPTIAVAGLGTDTLS